ncbi:ATP-binding cassette, subfamily B, bacterial [Novimethylophilus kurashikiensis]|uniref:ATP-binding cassette, subfamily B, bacterial n=1 Tax=Novimethylophilus kurashikiensis TaxID=1825523 RepID=A0A2R5F4J1_9PROT|nr:ABC transporter transmembrane domain-containing protein [Novimethylophilus kurashikiensis]GBG12658.1 ATP-binding cassette, subfamily B, bacterial [Novimethylophilus kurashikiensis]
MARANLIDRPKSKDIRQLARILGFLKPYRRQIVTASIALVIASGCVLALGQGLKFVIDRGLAGGNTGFLNQALGGMLAIVVVMAAATFVRFYYVSWIGERVTADIRRAVFGHLLELSPGFFETTRTGEVISRLTSDTTVLEDAIGSSISMALRNFLNMLGALIMLVVTSPKLTGLVLVVVPLVIAPIVFFGRRVRKLARASQDRVADVGAYIDEALHEIRTVQAYGHEAQDKTLFGERVEQVFATSVRRIRQRASLMAVVILLVFGAIGFILWVGGHDVVEGNLTGGQLSAFIFYAVILAVGVGTVSEVIGDLQRAAGATERLMELLSTEPEIAAPQHPQALPYPVQGVIAFDEVLFHYPSRPDAPALERLSLTVSAGEKLALVGPSGAGKSTVFQLLLRYYDPQAGSIRIDGVDIKAADPRIVRSHIALVPQDPVIFAASVADNVRYGRPDATEAEVRAACEAACATEFIDRLPEGLNAYLGERGVRLSGGQRQRIAIARAILADRPILLLDEATSALDAASERLVQIALERLMESRTTLIIAHRFATVQGVDRIAVMDQGRIVGLGTHEALMRDNALYAHLANLQFKPVAT